MYTEYPRELDPDIDAGSAKKSRTFLVLEELWSGAQSRWAGWRGRSLRIQSRKEQCCDRSEPVDPPDRAGGWRTEPEGDLTANAELLSCWHTGDVSSLENTVGRSIQGQSVCSFFFFFLLLRFTYLCLCVGVVVGGRSSLLFQLSLVAVSGGSSLVAVSGLLVVHRFWGKQALVVATRGLSYGPWFLEQGLSS